MRCATIPMQRAMKTMTAADQVACEFANPMREEFLAQAVREEHPEFGAEDAKVMAALFVKLDRAGFIA